MIIASAMFMENIDSTVLSTALPTMARDFGVPAPEMSVAVTAYLIALAVFIPVSGQLADRFGARVIFQAAIGCFMSGSLACALSPSLPTLACARFFQGMGGAMMVPVGRLVLLRTVSKQELLAAQAWMLMPGLIGAMLGPPLGGFIVTWLQWRWIFWINLPIGALGIYLVGRFITNFRPSERRAFDVVGFVLSGLALGALMFGFELAGAAGEGRLGWSVIGAGALMAGLYIRHALVHSNPVLDLSLLRFKTFRLTTLGGSLIRITHGAQAFLLSLVLQLGFGYSAVRTGSVTLAAAIGTIVMKGLAKPILARLGYRHGLMLMGVLACGGYSVCALFRPNWPFAAIFIVLTVAGFFMSFQFTAYNTLAFDEIPPERMSSATSFFSTLQQVTLSLGVCVAATIIQLASTLTGRSQPSLAQFSLAFAVVAAVGMTSFLVNIRIDPHAGAEMSGRATRMTPVSGEPTM